MFGGVAVVGEGASGGGEGSATGCLICPPVERPFLFADATSQRYLPTLLTLPFSWAQAVACVGRDDGVWLGGGWV